MSIDDRNEIKKQHIEYAVTVLENILELMNIDAFDEIPMHVDNTEGEDIEDLKRIIQTKLEGEMVDVYGTPCTFSPDYEYSQECFFTNDDNSGFHLEYDLTTNEELADITLILEFIYNEDGTLTSNLIGVNA